MTATGKLREALERHDLRRWIRFIKADNSFDYLRCYCGEKISEDSEEAMFTHVAEAALAESVAGQAASGAQREPDPPGVHEHDDHTGLCPECVDAGRKLAAMVIVGRATTCREETMTDATSAAKDGEK